MYAIRSYYDETYYYNGSAYVFDVSDWSLTQKIIPDSKGESLNFGIEGIALSILI